MGAVRWQVRRNPSKQAAWRARNRAAGKCTRCGGECAAGRLLCERHVLYERRKNREAMRRRRARRAAAGLCLRCDQPAGRWQLCPQHFQIHVGYQQSRTLRGQADARRRQQLADWERELLGSPPPPVASDPCKLALESTGELARYEQIKAGRAAKAWA